MIRLAFIEAEKRMDDIVNDMCSLMLKEISDALNTILTTTVFNSENMATQLKIGLKNLEMAVISNITSDLAEEQIGNPTCLTMIKEEASESANDRMVNGKKKIAYIRTSNVCSECNNAFSNQRSLRRHQKSIHLKLKDLKCKECNYTTSDGSGLYKHIEKYHPNIKKYACDIC